MTQFLSDAIFWIDLDKVSPNPFQPRKEFDEAKLRDLADSIRQYGVLQPIVVTRKEIQKADGGLDVEYELISGERRLRASKLAGIRQIPAVIRSSEESDLMKLELAIIENLQREDLNCVDRAKAFQKLVDDFNLKHTQIAQKIGRSREYVSNSLRILALPEHMLTAISEGKVSEGHTRPLLMLADRKDEQETLFKEIIYKKITVRDAEIIARKIAVEKTRKKETVFDPELASLEEKFAESLGTRVHIEKGQNGGTITIDFFSNDDVRAILDLVNSREKRKVSELLDRHIAAAGEPATKNEDAELLDDRSAGEKKEDEDNLYSVKNFSL
ncbi:MAG: ParB/RepB/Spo0J family partition protein [Patescibacteria group bacterium]|nr:ParB/RepB/Spo0J family partition protein [Patescibacteria group bacterium]MDE1946036.1 ParB/RepB/Spo0J family partition protein [Patescibacteria group bacterium]